MPPVPKRPEIRQRTNKAATRVTLLDEPVQRGRAPRLPKRGEGDPPWHRMTRAWWRDCWRSPLAGEYLQVDIHGLFRLAVLIDQFWHAPTASLAGEIRLQQQAFGQSPIDRRRLEWSIVQTEDATARRQMRRVRQAQAGEIDPRDVLKVVGDK